jgi:ubiquinone/menaquinone biosynthesis C-methylase UbiE
MRWCGRSRRLAAGDPLMRVATKPDSIFDRLALTFAPGLVPTPLFEGFVAMMMARTIMAATSLGVFRALDERPDGVEGLARRLEIDPHGSDVLLKSLHALGYVEWRDGAYRNARVVERFLLPQSHASQERWVGEFGYDMWDTFSALEDVLRTGKPIGLHDRPADDPYWERYMRGLFDLSKLRGDFVARAIPADSPRRLLDLAGGHGGFAMALCRRHDELKATIVELEGAARIGRRIVHEEGMDDRVEYSVGDMFELDLGHDFDIVTAFSIVHHFDRERNVELLKRARAALRPGGTVAIYELDRPADDEPGTQLGALDGLLFYALSGARTYTGEEIAGWLGEVGFSRVKVKRPPQIEGTVLVVGRA